MDIITTRPKLKTDVRWLIRDEVAAALAIEQATCPIQPWDETELLMNLRCRNVIGMVAEYLPCYPCRTPRHIVGYEVYQLCKHHLELLKCAVHPDSQRQGVGRQLVETLKRKVVHFRRRSLAVNVWESDLAAQLFFKAMGLQAVSVVRRPESMRDEDAYRMVWQL